MTKNETAKIIATITSVAATYDLPADYMITMAWIESSFNPRASNRSGAAGLYQFMPTTARSFGLSNVWDAGASAVAAAKYTISNRRYLATRGAPDEPWVWYLAHQQGCGGAWMILSAAARGSAPSPTIRRNMAANGGRGLSCAQFCEMWEKLYATKAATAARIAGGGAA